MERRSWLVQRLERPRERPEGHPLFGKTNPFSFGGGLKNGGLSDDAMKLVGDIWRFGYMGAAEFEFGAVPEALRKIAQAKLEAFVYRFPLADVPANWRDKNPETPTGDATVYVLAPVGWDEEIKRRIYGWATESRGEDYRLKEPTRLASALRPVEDWDRDVCGWLELNNGFLFFTDAPMWEKACALFGVETAGIESEVAA